MRPDPSAAPGTWIVAADNAHARLFTRPETQDEFVEVETLVNPDARLHDLQLVSDRAGRLNSRRPGGHSVRKRDGAHQRRADEFARAVAHRLEALRRSGALKSLHVIAARRFVGLLHKHFSAALHATLLSEVQRSITRRPTAEILAEVPASGAPSPARQVDAQSLDRG